MTLPYMCLFMNLQFMTLWTCSYQHFLRGVCISSAPFPCFHIYEVIIWHFCKYILQGDYYTYCQQEQSFEIWCHLNSNLAKLLAITITFHANVSSTISHTLERHIRGNLVLSYSSAFYNYSIALLNHLRTKFVQEHAITKCWKENLVVFDVYS